MGNNIGIDSSPTDSIPCFNDSLDNLNQCYSSQFNCYVLIWELYPEVSDSDIILCKPVDIKKLTNFIGFKSYILLYVQNTKFDYFKKQKTDDFTTVRLKKLCQSFSVLNKESLKHPLTYSNKDNFIKQSSSFFDIYVWTGINASLITKSVAIAKAHYFSTCLQKLIKTTGSLKTFNTCEFVPLFSTLSNDIRTLIHDFSDENAFLQSILKVLPRFPTKSLPIVGRKQKYADLKRNKATEVKSLGALGLPSLKIPTKDTGNGIIVPPSEAKLKADKLLKYSIICSEISTNLFISGEKVASNSKILKENNITHIINCAGLACENYFPNDFTYLRLCLYDGVNEDISCLFLNIIEFIENALNQGGKILFHCQQGVSRSASFLIMYLMWREKKTFNEILQRVKQIRGICNPNTGFIFQLINWAKRLGLSDSSPHPWISLIGIHSKNEPNTVIAKTIEIKNENLSLDPRGIYLIEDSNIIYKWVGNKSSPNLLNASNIYEERLRKYLNNTNETLIIKQDSETKEFLKLLNIDNINIKENPLLDKHLCL